MTFIRIYLAALLAAVLLTAGWCHHAQAKTPFSQCTGTTYYFAVNGSDSANGTSTATPWRTITKFNAANFGPADCVNFRGGDTFSGTLNITAAHFTGTALAPVTIGSYGTGRATINGGSSDGIDITNVAGIAIRDLILVGASNTAISNWGVYLSAAADTTTKYNFIYLLNLDLSGFRTGILLGGDNGASGFTNVSFVKIVAHDNWDSGIGSYGTSAVPSYSHTNVFVDQAQTYNNTGKAGAGTPTGNGVVLGSVKSGVVRRSVAYNNGALDNFGSVGLWAFDSRNMIFEFCESYANLNAGNFDGTGFDLDGNVTESVLQYSYAHGNQGSGLLAGQGFTVYFWGFNTVRYNIFENNGTGASNNVKAEVTLGNTSPATGPLWVYGNTLYKSNGGNPLVEVVNSATVAATLANNIMVASGAANFISTGVLNPASIIFTGNDYSGSGTFRWNSTTYATVALWRAGVATQETFRGANTSLTSNPSLTSPGAGGTCYSSGTPAGPQPCPSAYLLQAGSAMLTAGQNMTTVFGIFPGLRDYYGNAVPAPSNGVYDVGANQRSQ